MKVHVLFFAILREKMKCAERSYCVSAGETIAGLAHRLLEPVVENKSFDQSLLYAVNNNYVDADYRLQDGDEVTFVPPVAGG